MKDHMQLLNAFSIKIFFPLPDLFVYLFIYYILTSLRSRQL